MKKVFTLILVTVLLYSISAITTGFSSGLVLAQNTNNYSKGDANGDLKVDGQDYTIWLNHYGQAVSSGAEGDFSTDNQVDGIDYIIWLNNYNTVLTSSNSPLSSYYPYGIFEDGNIWSGTASRTTLQTDLNTLKSKNITDILFTNSTPNVDLLDSNGFKVVAAPMNILNSQWWNNNLVTQNLATAKSIAGPIIDGLKNNPSVIAFNLVDDAAGFTPAKLSLMTTAFNELSPTRPATVMNPGVDRFLAVNPPYQLGYFYPAKTTNLACDFNSKTVKGRYVNNFAQLLEVDRDLFKLDEKNIPFWQVLQTHGASPTTDPAVSNINQLRTPTVEEVRIQNWTAISEGVKGIYWFIFKTQQYWIGLQDNIALLNEVSDLSKRVKPISTTLLNLKNYDHELFTATASPSLPAVNKPLITTMVSKDNTRWYTVVVNHSCNDQSLVVNSIYTTGALKDLETGNIYQLGQSLPFRGGDGKIFEIIGQVQLPSLTTNPNLITNPSLEEGTATTATGWSVPASVTRDTSTAHSGTSSLKLTGPLALSYFKLPINGTFKSNTKYSISYWVKTSNVTTPGVAMRYVHISPSVGISLSPFSMTWANQTNNTWRQITTEFYTFSELTSNRFDLQFDINSGGTAWVDDIVVCEGKDNCSGIATN